MLWHAMHVALLEAEELYIEDESRVGRDELQSHKSWSAMCYTIWRPGTTR